MTFKCYRKKCRNGCESKLMYILSQWSYIRICSIWSDVYFCMLLGIPGLNLCLDPALFCLNSIVLPLLLFRRDLYTLFNVQFITRCSYIYNYWASKSFNVLHALNRKISCTTNNIYIIHWFFSQLLRKLIIHLVFLLL